jgi:hypothetical protein
VVVWECRTHDEILAAQARPRLVVKSGMVSVEREEIVREPWRLPGRRAPS